MLTTKCGSSTFTSICQVLGWMGKAKLPQLHLKLVKCQTWYLPFKTSLSCFPTAGKLDTILFFFWEDTLAFLPKSYSTSLFFAPLRVPWVSREVEMFKKNRICLFGSLFYRQNGMGIKKTLKVTVFGYLSAEKQQTKPKMNLPTWTFSLLLTPKDDHKHYGDIKA